MKVQWKEWACVFLTSILIPCLLTMLLSGTSQKAGMRKSGIVIKTENGETLDAEEFLLYAVAGQVDLNCHEEVLKAQCVIARTNLMRELDGKREVDMKDLELVYLTPQKFENSFGDSQKENLIKKLTGIINATYPYVLTYEDDYIEALYHPISIGNTVSAEEAFGKIRPYLIEVESSQDVEAEEYMTLSMWTGKELLAKLQGIGIGKNQTTDTIFSSLRLAAKTKNGYVKQVSIGTEQLSGDEWKRLFGLNSTHFYLEEQDGQLRMIVLGKGHGVGLSQYGAERLAEEGWNWKDILMKYYPGTMLTK